MVMTLAFLVALIGGVAYLLLAPEPLKSRVAELARIAYFCGLLTLLLVIGRKVL